MITLNDIPPYNFFIPPIVAALKRLGGSASNDEIHDEVVELLRLPDNIVEFPHKDQSITELAYRLAWARTYLKKVGAIENATRAIWTLTAKGRDMTDDELRNVHRAAKVERKKPPLKRVESAPELSEAEIDQDEPGWIERLLSVLLTMKPDAFERLCQRILRESGFTKVEVTGKSGDGGIDGNGVLRVKLVSFQVLFQCKRWKDSVGSSVVRDFRGAMVGRADKGLIMTTGRFTTEARREATRDGAPAVDLIDGEDLCQLLKELGIGVKVRHVEEVEIDEVVLAAI